MIVKERHAAYRTDQVTGNEENFAQLPERSCSIVECIFCTRGDHDERVSILRNIAAIAIESTSQSLCYPSIVFDISIPGIFAASSERSTNENDGSIFETSPITTDLSFSPIEIDPSKSILISKGIAFYHFVIDVLIIFQLNCLVALVVRFRRKR